MPSYERIIAAGAPGSSKTHSWLTIAEALPNSTFHVFDPEDGAERIRAASFPHVKNICYYSTPFWFKKLEHIGEKGWFGGVSESFSKVRQEVKPGDWVVVESLPSIWDIAQSGFVGAVWDKGIGEYFLERRKAMENAGAKSKKLEAFDGWKDWCTDDQTEIMTLHGWKKYTGLKQGEKVLALSASPWGSRWEPVLDLYVGPHKNRTMVHLDGVSHNSLTTQDHRWLVESQIGGRKYVTRWKTSKTLSTNDRIPTQAPRLDLPQQARYSDTLVELAAWHMTEGCALHPTDRPSTRVIISQSETIHPNYVRQIRLALSIEFGSHGWCEKRRDSGVVEMWLNSGPSHVLDTLAPNKLPTKEFLHSLTLGQLDIFISTCLAGDGSVRPTGQRSFAQSNRERAETFELACILRGLPTRSWDRTRPVRWGKPDSYEISLLSSRGSFPIGAVAQLPYHEEKGLSGRAIAEEVTHEGIVWCPVTPSGTWLARRGGKVYFTGNSVIKKMHNDDFIIPICFQLPVHSYMTSSLSVTTMGEKEKEDPDIRGFYGDSLVRVDGEKRNVFRVQTILIFYGNKKTGWSYSTFVKDRGNREWKDRAPLVNFAAQYLGGVAKMPGILG